MRKEASLDFVEKYYLDDLNEIESEESKFYLSWLKHVKGKCVLSLGCGPNLYNDVSFFGEIPKKLVGIDINKNNIKFLEESKNSELLKAKRFVDERKIKVELFVEDILKPKKEFFNKFDTIYALGVIGMLKEDDLIRVLKLIKLYLKPQGTFLDVDWTDCQLSKEKYKERESYGWYSLQGPDIERLGSLINQSGFKILKHEIFDVPNKKEYLWGKIYGYLVQKD